jgi:hypothetical protein
MQLARDRQASRRQFVRVRLQGAQKSLASQEQIGLVHRGGALGTHLCACGPDMLGKRSASVGGSMGMETAVSISIGTTSALSRASGAGRRDAFDSTPGSVVAWTL